MECLNFALAFILFQSFYSIATGDNTTRGPRVLLDVARPFVESPQSRGRAGGVSFPAVSAVRHLVTSAREEAGSLLLPEDVRFFDWLLKTSVRTCCPFRVHSERGRPCGGVCRGFWTRHQHPSPFHQGFGLGSPLVGGSRILRKHSTTPTPQGCGGPLGRQEDGGSIGLRDF